MVTLHTDLMSSSPSSAVGVCTGVISGNLSAEDNSTIHNNKTIIYLFWLARHTIATTGKSQLSWDKHMDWFFVNQTSTCHKQLD